MSTKIPLLTDMSFISRIDNAIYESRRKSLQAWHIAISSYPGLKRLEGNAFLMQISRLEALLPPLTDEERNAAIDIVLSSGVYDKVGEKEEEKDSEFNYIDELVKELLRWFKEEFFKWVNKADCRQCGNDAQESIRMLGVAKPFKPDHFEGKANTVEVYQCMKCNSRIEFPRYNDIRYLLRERRGRCGEWNNCFIAILRSLDIDVRYIWNAEDHVWCEYYSSKLRRWIHLDSCENAYDQPLLYSDGWGKKMSYVFAVGRGYIIDVSAKYIGKDKPDQQLPREKISEQDLKRFLALLNCRKLLQLEKMDMLRETSHIMADFWSSRPETTEDSIKVEKDVDDNFKPRQSGSAEWTSKRGESGQ